MSSYASGYGSAYGGGYSGLSSYGSNNTYASPYGTHTLNKLSLPNPTP